MSIPDADRFVYLLSEGRGRKRYRALPKQTEELIPGLLYRYMLLDTVTNEMAMLALFLRVGELGGALWEQEMRTLERLAGMRHPSLPILVDGGYLEGADGEPGAAYIRTERSGLPGSIDRLYEMFGSRRGDALLHLWMLADALAVLADAHIAHRHLWPGNVDVEVVGGRIEAVRLSRFGLSGLISNLFRRGDDLQLQQLRRLYLDAPSASRCYSPPERVRFMFGRPDAELGGPEGDIFSLGMMATEWLLGGPVEAGSPDTYDGILERQTATRRELVRRGNQLPAALGSVLQDMLDPTPRNRPTAFQVSQAVAGDYRDARAVLDDDLPAQPYLIAYMPDQCDQTLLTWQVTQNSAMTEEGRDQLVALIERDMRGAEILYSPNGAVNFAQGDAAKLRAAKAVIVGPRITWFCEHLFLQEDGDPVVSYDTILVIKFVRKTEDIQVALTALRTGALSRLVPSVDAEPMPRSHDVAQLLADGRPSWRQLAARVESVKNLSSTEQDYLAALDWFIRYQRAQLEARTYAYVREPDDTAGQAILRWDPVRDRSRKMSDALGGRAVQAPRRPDLAVFVEDADDEEGAGIRIAVAEGRDFAAAKVHDLIRTIGTDVIVLKLDRGSTVPDQGWVRLDADSGTVPQLNRQAEARVELESQRVLLGQLINPRAQPLIGQNWAHAGGGLKGEGREAVVDMLRQGAMFALQGPPGTGKTEVTSQAVADYVRARPESRVLVSAQSHDALENLAARVLEKLGMVRHGGHEARLDRLALRVGRVPTSREMDPRVAQFRPGPLVQGVLRYSRSQALDWLTSRRTERPDLVPVVTDWLELVPNTQLELSRRARVAANIVFATTGGSTSRNLVEDGTDEPFHWVVVEEAAKAWPSELVIPLVRGLRWTLIGDHQQIGAYAKSEIYSFLFSCAESDDEEIRAMGEARDTYADAFETFARIFARPDPSTPRRTLTEERRMDAELTALVGKVFYADTGGLVPARDRKAPPLMAPGVLTGSRLVWIDTGLAERCVGFWSNDYEADLCAALIQAMKPAQGIGGSADGPSLAVLTPYRQQVKVLQRRLADLGSRVHTVDGFQGQEADIVVASLVRDKKGRDGGLRSTVGHVGSSARTNVLLSRARELLVVVGRFDIYAQHAGKSWSRVTEHFADHGTIVRAESVATS